MAREARTVREGEVGLHDEKYVGGVIDWKCERWLECERNKRQACCSRDGKDGYGVGRWWLEAKGYSSKRGKLRTRREKVAKVSLSLNRESPIRRATHREACRRVGFETDLNASQKSAL